MSGDAYVLTLAGPGKNALGTTLMEETITRIDAAAGRPLLLTGAGDAFSAGLDLREVERLDPPGMTRFLGLLDRLVEALFTYPGPVVAAVNGHAIAGGCILALCSDLRLVADDPRIRIGLNEVPLGLLFPPALLALVRYRVPPRSIERVVLEGALHPPAVARELGLVDEVVPDAVAAGRTALDRLAAAPAAVYASTKRALREGALELTAAERRDLHERIVPWWCSPEVKERVRDLLARRR